MILIPKDVLAQALIAAAEAYPGEACGLLIGYRGPGDRRRVTRLELSPNLAADPATAFEVDPGLRIGLERELRDQEQELVGIFHSHPNGSARPSARDLASALEPRLAWLIVAVDKGTPIQTLAFLLADDGGGFREIPVHMH